MALQPAEVKQLFETKAGVEPVPLRERRTDELIIGMVGPIASGVSFTAERISNILKNDFKYDGQILKVSRFINQNSSKLGKAPAAEDDPERVKKLQEIGSDLRAKYGNDYLAEKCVEEINLGRGNPKGLTKPRRFFTIVDSLKNPDEVGRLRTVYGDNFWLFGVFAPEPVRKERMLAMGTSSVAAELAIRTDEDEGHPSGQLVRDTMQISDFFVRNDRQNAERLEKTILRFLDILFGTSIATPTIDETSMFNATSAASGSACMSRQVGAVITAANGDVIGRGTNDVPKFGGGLYSTSDGEADHRCYKWKQNQCHNDSRKKLLFEQSLQKLKTEGVLRGSTDNKALAALKSTGFRNLIEFSRSIHAEMEAIISVARAGKQGLVGSTLYSTTFPCHSCARHIVASGISKVVYVEPYSKSLALDLHNDAISIQESDTGKVQFLQYEGVAPKNAVRLFRERGERKTDGKLSLAKRTEAHPATHGMIDGLADREQIVVAELRQREFCCIWRGHRCEGVKTINWNSI